MIIEVTQEHLDKAISLHGTLETALCRDCVMGVAVNELLKPAFFSDVAGAAINIRDASYKGYYLNAPTLWGESFHNETFRDNVHAFDAKRYDDVILGPVEIPDIPAEYLK